MKKFFVLIVVFMMLFSLVACGRSPDNQTPDENYKQEQSIEEVSAEKLANEQSEVDIFIKEYNKTATNPITDINEIDVTDKESGHYRTEFRLQVFSESYAKTGKIGDITVDIVSYGENNKNIRVYAYGINLEQAKEIIRNASSILDSALSNENIEEVLNYLDENQEANGYYYGEIGLTLLGKYKESYELMLKVE